MSFVKECRVGGTLVLLHLDSDDEESDTPNKELWRAQTYETQEPNTIEWIDTFVDPGDILYDVGANIGQYSLYSAIKLDKRVKVFAFEPEALNFAKLNRNIVLNDLCGVVIPYCLAVGGHNGLDTFYTNTFAPGAALHSLSRAETQGEVSFTPENTQGMMSVTLDGLVYRYGAPAPNHIKIDVDGIEEEIVAGAHRLLSIESLRSVLIEVYMYKDAAHRIIEAFSKAGMHLSNGDSIDFSEGTAQNLIFRRS